jgi:hypothetical protein
MLGRPDLERAPDIRRLSEFFAGPKNSHGACSVAGN